MKGYAPGWQVRCTGCGWARDASEVGIIRLGAWSWKKFTLGWCSRCRRWRFLAIERKPSLADKAATQAADV